MYYWWEQLEVQDVVVEKKNPKNLKYKKLFSFFLKKNCSFFSFFLEYNLKLYHLGLLCLPIKFTILSL